MTQFEWADAHPGHVVDAVYDDNGLTRMECAQCQATWTKDLVQPCATVLHDLSPVRTG